MVDPINTAAPAAQPAAAPVVSPAPAARPAAAQPANPNAQALTEQSGGAGAKDFDPGLKGPLNPNPVAVGAAPTKKFPARSPLITNPKPAEEYEEEKDPADMELPASTIAEMEAGRAALERNKPRSMAAARAAEETPRDTEGRQLPKA